MPPLSRKKAAELQNNLLFLSILKDFYPQILTSSQKLPVWKQVLDECRRNGFYGDQSARYLGRFRWPALIGATTNKWKSKKKELGEKDIRIIEIERMRTPDYCFPMNAEEKAMQKANVAEVSEPALDDQMADVVESSNVDDVSVEELVIDNSIGNNPDDAHDEFNDNTDESFDTFSSVTGLSLPMLLLPETANQPNNVLAPRTNLQNEFFRAGIRAMDLCTEYAQLKLNMMRQNLANSGNKNAT
uniref:Uncharacterized protein n=1 Tax=Panagrolaimus davidi TaxID=227884 RepID=A0A914PGZ0_9BILA